MYIVERSATSMRIFIIILIVLLVLLGQFSTLAIMRASTWADQEAERQQKELADEKRRQTEEKGDDNKNTEE